MSKEEEESENSTTQQRSEVHGFGISTYRIDGSNGCGLTEISAKSTASTNPRTVHLCSWTRFCRLIQKSEVHGFGISTYRIDGSIGCGLTEISAKSTANTNPRTIDLCSWTRFCRHPLRKTEAFLSMPEEKESENEHETTQTERGPWLPDLHRRVDGSRICIG
jgi:hypothetical protein